MTDKSSELKLSGEIKVPGDKSISHRSIMLGSIAKGKTEINGFLPGADCLSTIECFRALGADIEEQNNRVVINGQGMHGLKKPSHILDCGNSGTTTRLISGILCAQDFSCTLTGDSSIQGRPMGRIITPLRLMGADIKSMGENGCAPLSIKGSRLHGIDFASPVASAQVKSCILLAGLYADSPTCVTEPSLSRNHTELMLKYFGADISSGYDQSGHATAKVSPAKELFGNKIDIPGDISSAAFFLAAAAMLPGSDLIIRHVGINPTRDGMLEVLKKMGADIKTEKIYDSAEPSADIRITSPCGKLHGITIEGKLIPRLIDELPVIAALATRAEGKTVIKDAAELKVKESDRIHVMTHELLKIGAHVEETPDGMIIEGNFPLHGADINTHKDHRIAMTFEVLSLACSGSIKVDDRNCVKISYPSFYDDLNMLII